MDLRKKNVNPNLCSATLDYWSWYKIEVNIYDDHLANHKKRLDQRSVYIVWCEDYMSGPWFLNANGYFYFKDEDDAMFFKLSWV